MTNESAYFMSEYPDGRGFAVFKRCNGFNQQIGPWYTYKHNAVKALNKLREKEAADNGSV